MESKGIIFESRLLVNRISAEENISSFLTELAEKKPQVFAHCCNVAYLAAQVGLMHKYDDTEDLVRGALLHDIGKIFISDDILLKKGKLDPDEWNFIKEHPQYGILLLKDAGFTQPVLDIVKYHHEKKDGSGYPDGLLSADIPRGAKVIGVCDIYEAMTAPRTYGQEYNAREAMTLMSIMSISQTAISHLKDCPDI